MKTRVEDGQEKLKWRFQN